jgi:pre-mRNA-splicing factor ATP-dependent RNA helicase DHX38/PRP16
MDEVHRLEASAPQSGGLIIKKKDGDEKKSVFKLPQSKFGLDLLAKKLKKERETGLLTSFKDHDEEDDAKKLREDTEEDDEGKFKKSDGKSKNYRSTDPETPSYQSAVTKSVREHYNERISDKSKGLYMSSKDKHKDRGSDDKYRDRRRTHKSSRDRERDRDYDRKRSRHDSSHRSYKDRSSHRYWDEPETPRSYDGKSSMSKSSWDDDDEDEHKFKKKKSAWDFPTPKEYKSRGPNDSVRSNRSSKSFKKYEDDTPRPTPAHKFNKWAPDRKASGATPRVNKNSSDPDKPWENEEDRDLWEEEQIRLDREWYNMDEGYDDENNPFAGASADYLKKREEQIEMRKRKRISAQQRQINKDNELWEKNRMITSGVVQKINFNEDFEEETIERVNLLVHHAIPPFLDGRIVFTKIMGE